jgi:hypothetical protein
MEQRRLRLGDILDDYCPRERRVTNHAIVAMVEDDVKQTRCTTCDSEHAYKGGKEPRRRKKDATAVLYKEVLAGMPEASEAAHPATSEPPSPPVLVATEPEPVVMAEAVPSSYEDLSDAIDEPAAEDSVVEEPRADVDEGPFHRRLIRATLPRPEGQKDVRQVPDFTFRPNGTRSNGHGHNAFRAKMRGQGGGGNGNRPQGGRRFGGGVPGERSGRPGFGAGNPQRPRNRKRSR